MFLLHKGNHLPQKVMFQTTKLEIYREPCSSDKRGMGFGMA